MSGKAMDGRVSVWGLWTGRRQPAGLSSPRPCECSWDAKCLMLSSPHPALHLLEPLSHSFRFLISHKPCSLVARIFATAFCFQSLYRLPVGSSPALFKASLPIFKQTGHPCLLLFAAPNIWVLGRASSALCLLLLWAPAPGICPLIHAS